MDRSGSPETRRASWFPRKPWQIALLGLFSLFATGIVVLAVVVAVLLPTLPPVRDLSQVELKVPLRVYTADGLLIAEFGEEKRIPVKIENVPPQLVQAILAAEDHSFYSHHGVDFLGIVRAAWRNFQTSSTSQGASTITMQVARNFFLSPEKTYTRKLREVLLAFKIEQELTKDEILELYINKIFLGHRAYGFAAAAQIYYGTTLDKLTLAEIALLAGLPKAPSRDNPLTNPEGALERRNYVLRHMHGLGYIDEAALERALNAPLTASRHALRYEADAPYVAEMVRQYMFQTYDEKTYAGGFHVYTTIDSQHQRAADRALRRALLEYDRRHGYRGAAGHVTLREPIEADRLDDALKDFRIVGHLVPGVVVSVEERTASVYTLDGVTVSLEWEGLSWARPYIDENTVGTAPKLAAQIVKRGDIVYLEPPEGAQPGAENGKGWRLAQIPQVAGALVALRPRDGAILALAGGFDFYHSSFNRATQAQRQPGSSLKPFVYTAALEKGFTPASTVSGAPIVIEDANLEDEWRPENYSRRFFGPTRLRRALALSLNTVSIRLVRAIGPAYAANYLTRFGFAPEALPRNLSLALGNASATPLQMAAAFAVYANGGFRVQPYFIARVEDARHNVLEQAAPLIACADCPAGDTAAAAVSGGTSVAHEGGESKGTGRPDAAPRVLTPELAFLMTSMMQDVIREGTGTGAKSLGRKDLAGKTGTTDDYRDAWFSGYNQELVATAWVGFDQATSLGRGEAGGRTALPMWVDYMRVALEGIPERLPEPPAGVMTAYVHAETGEPVASDTPDAIEEYFVRAPGTENRAADTETPEAPEATAAAPVPPPSENVREKLF